MKLILAIISILAISIFSISDGLSEESSIPEEIKAIPSPAIGDGYGIVIDKSTFSLILYKGQEILKIYPIAIGAVESETPVGRFEIINKVTDPVWYWEGKAISPYKKNKNNQLGTRWIGISEPHYGIHGNNDPSSIGKAISHGCIRMHNKDIEELADIVPIGTPVVIIK